MGDGDEVAAEPKVLTYAKFELRPLPEPLAPLNIIYVSFSHLKKELNV